MIEGTVDYQQVINVRKAGIDQIKHQDGRQKKLDSIEAEIQRTLKEKIGMGVFMSSTKKQTIEREVRQSFKAKIEKVKTDYDEHFLDYTISDSVAGLIDEFQQQDVGVDQMFDPSQLPKDYVQFLTCLKIPSLKISLDNEFDQRITTLEIKALDFDMTHAAKFTIFKMEMEEMLIDDDWSGNKRWPKLVGSNKDIQ